MGDSEKGREGVRGVEGKGGGVGAVEGLSRRRFLSAGTGAAAALAFGGTAVGLEGAAEPAQVGGHGHSGGTLVEVPPPGVLDTEWFQPFCEPPVQSSSGGVLDTTLRVVEAAVPIAEPGRVRVEQTRTYNGHVPGPTLRVLPGDTLQVRLVNELPPNTEEACPPPDPNIPHCFNTTNLHTHGLHVSPLPPSDDVFLHLEPGQEFPICVVLPDFHAPGTYWYHAHKHGSTALQLVNGLAGALIVADRPGHAPVPDARDRVFVLQEIIGDRIREALYQEFDVEEPADGPSDVYTCTGGSPCSEELFTINGCYRPTISMRPGEVQRWRFINATATPRGYTKLQVVATTSEFQHCLIAVDGIYLPEPRLVGEWLLPPGGRADFMMRFPHAGTYQLLRVPIQGQCENQVLADVVVDGPFLNMSCPATLPAQPPYLETITDEQWRAAGGVERNLTFDIVTDPQVPCSRKFLINGKSFDPNRIDQSIKLGAIERWNVTNTGPASHPFHIHVNPFQVIEIGGVPIPEEKRFWQDTVDLPPFTTVSFYSRFQTFHGRFVLHCHILNHEDWGMMQNVEVVGDGEPPCVPVPFVP